MSTLRATVVVIFGFLGLSCVTPAHRMAPDIDGDGVVDYKDASLSPEQTFSAFRSALIAGNVDAAVQFLERPKRARYREAWSKLGPDAGEVMKGITKTTVLSSGDQYAEIAVNRVVNGELRLFIVTLIKDSNGVWRISQL